MKLKLTCHSRQAREVCNEVLAVPALDSRLTPSLSKYSPGSSRREGTRRREETWDHCARWTSSLSGRADFARARHLLSFRCRRAVSTTRCVKAFVGNEEAFDGLAVHNVRLDDLFHIVSCYMSIPDAVGITEHGGAVLTLIEEARRVGAHSLLKTAQR